MVHRVYLDTARLGQMSPSAQLAHIDFTRWAGEEAGSLYFEEFLRHGFSALPPALQTRFPGLTTWRGISHLKHDLKSLAGARPESRVLLASRSTQLMRFGAKLLCWPCRNVLVTDLSWPNYAEILRREAQHSGTAVTSLRVRGFLLRGVMTAGDFVERLATTFQRRGCDGLFVPAVDNHGIRVPLQSLVAELRRRAELRFVVVDGAQELGHVPLNLAADDCDFYLAGCHKWLRACYPLGLAFYGRPESRHGIDAALRKMLPAGEIDDPLLAFTEELVSGEPSQFGETVNLAPLFSCCGAVHDALSPGSHRQPRFSVRLENAAGVVRIAHDAGWTGLQPQVPFRSGIVLLRCSDPAVQAHSPQALRRHLIRHGIAATAYEGGIVRLSMPDRLLNTGDLDLLETALRSLSPCGGMSTFDQQPAVRHFVSGSASGI